MEQEGIIRLALRGVKDIQTQAEKIVSGDKSSATIENFARYSNELKDYITKNISNEKVNSYLKEIQDVNYKRVSVKLWHYLILPSWFILLYKDTIAKNRTIEEINTVRGKYAHLELILRQQA